MVTMGTRKLWTCWQGTLRFATEIRWYRNVVSRWSVVQSVALLLISAMRLWASSDKGPRVSTATGIKHASGGKRTWSSFLQHFLPVAHFATRRMLLVCEQPSHPTWHCAPTAMVPTSSHRVSFRLLCWDPAGVFDRIRAQWINSSTLPDCFLQDSACWQEDPPWRRMGQEWA